MAFAKTGLVAVAFGGAVGAAPGNRKGLYFYATNDARTGSGGVEDTGYFNAASALLNVGDVIIASIDVDGTPAGAAYVVSGNTAGVVAVTRFVDLIGE